LNSAYMDAYTYSQKRKRYLHIQHKNKQTGGGVSSSIQQRQKTESNPTRSSTQRKQSSVEESRFGRASDSFLQTLLFSVLCSLLCSLSSSLFFSHFILFVCPVTHKHLHFLLYLVHNLAISSRLFSCSFRVTISSQRNDPRVIYRRGSEVPLLLLPLTSVGVVAPLLSPTLFFVLRVSGKG